MFVYVCSSKTLREFYVCVQFLSYLLIHSTSNVIAFKGCYDVHRPDDKNIAERALALLKLLEFMNIKYSGLRFDEFSLQIMLSLCNDSLLEYKHKIS